MSAKGEVGMRIDLDKVPTRQKNMKAWELLLSESQERMLLVAEKGREQEVTKIFHKWDLPCSVIGEVTDDGILNFYMNDELEASIPAYDLVLGGGAPQYEREYREPKYLNEIKKFDPDSIAVPGDLKSVAEKLIILPTIASKRWIYNQYDSMVCTNNASTNAPTDAPVVLVKGTTKGLAITTDCNSRYVFADPYKGAMIAVSEAARNIVCSGGEPLGVTNCLNFGNPYDPEVYYQFVQVIKGMGDACRKFDTPVTNVGAVFFPLRPICQIHFSTCHKDLMDAICRAVHDHLYILIRHHRTLLLKRHKQAGYFFQYNSSRSSWNNQHLVFQEGDNQTPWYQSAHPNEKQNRYAWGAPVAIQTILPVQLL